MEGSPVGRRRWHPARPGRFHRPWRPAAQHGAPPGREPWPGTTRAGIGPAGLAGRPPVGSARPVAALVAGHGAGAHHPPAARHPDGVRHAVAAALQQPSLCRGQRFHHRPVLHLATAARGSGRRHRVIYQGAALECSHVGAQHRLPGVECAGTAACARRSGGFVASQRNGNQPDAGHARPIQHRAVACCGHGVGALPRGLLLLAGWHAPRCLDLPSARRRSAPAARRQPPCATAVMVQPRVHAHASEQPGAAHHHRPAHGAGALLFLPLRHRPGPLPGERDRPSGSAMAAP